MQDHQLKRIAIACGGTGGHFYPGYVLAQALRKKGWETLFILRRDDPAIARLTREDLPFVEIDLRGMPRSLSLAWLQFPFKVAGSLRLTRNVLRAFHPRCVVGMGGYLTFPAVLTARYLHIPSMIHEANSKLGLANRLCLPFVSKIALGLPLTTPLSSSSQKRCQITGTPIRPEFEQLPDPTESRKQLGLDPDKTTLLVFGGSQGARGINALVPAALKELAAQKPHSFQCLHITGTAEQLKVESLYSRISIKVVVLPYLQDIHCAYAAADLIISRSGASTLAELIAAQKPAILIPFPHATANHQDTNAELLVSAGTARRLTEAGLSPATLAMAVSDLILSDETGDSKLKEMRKGYSRLKHPKPHESMDLLVNMVEGL